VLATREQKIVPFTPIFTDHFSGPGRALGRVCVLRTKNVPFLVEHAYYDER